ncbi:MAG: LON peptidase substrate-binding domain-containing protein, partial [Turicibacter sp.]
MKINMHEVESYTLPVLPVRGVVPLPNTETRLEIGRDSSIQALEACEANGNYMILLSQNDPKIDIPAAEDLLTHGTIAKVVMKIKLPNGHYKVKFNSLIRVEIKEFIETEPFFEALVDTLPSIAMGSDEEEAMVRLIMNEVDEFGNLLFPHSHEVGPMLQLAVTGEKVSDIAAFYLKISEVDKVKYLKTTNVQERLKYLLTDFEKEKQMSQLEMLINQEVKKSVDEHQKEFYLREKIKAIQKELGDDYSKESVGQEFREKIETLEMPAAV